jgi:YD repeat-containing protein
MAGEDAALKSAEATLRKDLKDNNVGKFIRDLNADLTNDAFSKVPASITELKKVAHNELLAKHLIPDVELGDVDEKTIAFKDKKNADYTLTTSPADGHAELTDANEAYFSLNGDDLVAKPSKAHFAGDAKNPLEIKNQRDADTGRITKNDIGTFHYDDNGNLTKVEGPDWELKEEMKGDPPKSVRHWVTSDGKEFTKGPVLDQKTGAITYQIDDTTHTVRADYSDVTTNKSGQVVNVRHPDGTERAFTYDKGKLTQVDYTAPGNNPYKDQWKLEDGKWVNYKPKAPGSEEYVKDDTREPLKNIQVAADGTYTQTNKDGDTRAFNTDGGEGGTEKRDVNVDGGTVHWENGRIASIDYKGGKTRAFTYDGGKLTQSEYADPANHYKDKWVLEGEKGKETWVNYKGDDATPTKYTKDENAKSFKDIGVKSNGDYYEVSPDGKQIHVFHPNGTADDPVDLPATKPEVPPKGKDNLPPEADKTERDVKVNDSTVHWKDGQIASVTDKDGDKRVFKYESGKLTGIDYIANGETTPDPEQSWTKKSDHWENGEDPPAKKKDIGVTKDGDYYEVSEDGKKKHTVKTDGTEADADVTPEAPPTPPPAKKSMHDQWIEARVQAQKDSEKDVNDGDTHTVKFGDTMWDIARASAKKNSDDHHAPTNREIANEINRLIKNYNEANPDAKITNANNVPIGTEIDTSKDA